MEFTFQWRQMINKLENMYCDPCYLEIQSSMKVLLLYVEWSDKGSPVRQHLSIKLKEVREQAMYISKRRAAQVQRHSHSLILQLGVSEEQQDQSDNAD